MVPDKFNMVDMGGIDLIESQGLAVDGLYQRLVESIALCRYQCLYNWKFNGILIPPSYVEMKLREGEVWINEGVSVDEENVVHMYSIEPEPPAPILPVIQALQVEANGIYQVPEGVDGYNPVEVSVSTESVIEPLQVTENGVYTAPVGVDGYSPVSVNIPSDESVFTRIEPLHYDYIGGYVTSGSWVVGDTKARTDIYVVEAGNIYLINLGPVVGNRFRVSVFSTDPAEATGTLTGISLQEVSSPVPYYVMSPLFVADSNGFLAIGKTNQSVDDIETYISIFNPN